MQVPDRPLRHGDGEDEAEPDHGLLGGAEGAVRDIPGRAGEDQAVKKSLFICQKLVISKTISIKYILFNEEIFLLY